MQLSPATIQQVANDPANADMMRESKALIEAIMRRAATDWEFRQQLILAPNDAIAAQYRESFGKEIPAEALSVDLQFVEPQGDFTYVLPPRAGTEGELAEAELAAVAGGVTPSLIASYVVGVAVSAGVVYVVDKLTDEPAGTQAGS